MREHETPKRAYLLGRIVLLADERIGGYGGVNQIGDVVVDLSRT